MLNLHHNNYINIPAARRKHLHFKPHVVQQLNDQSPHEGYFDLKRQRWHVWIAEISSPNYCQISSPASNKYLMAWAKKEARYFLCMAFINMNGIDHKKRMNCHDGIIHQSSFTTVILYYFWARNTFQFSNPVRVAFRIFEIECCFPIFVYI